MGKSWLVTGAAGFIGSHLCYRLSRRGDAVTGFDDFSAGTRENAGRAAAAGGALLRMVEGDIRDREALAAALAGTEVAVHLAAQVSVPRSIADPRFNDSVNVGGFLNVLTAAGEAGVRTFVYASSCAVYGDNPDLPLHEEARPRPLSPYAVSKLSNELYGAALAASFPRMTIIGLRLFNVFGPRQNSQGGYASVIPRWLGLCMTGGRPQLFGDGTATRDFCHVDDVASALCIIGGMERPPGHAVYNVGSGVPTSLERLFAVITRAARKSGRDVDFDRPAEAPPRPGDILHSHADISRAEADFGYRPMVTLADGIGRMLDAEYGDGTDADAAAAGGTG